MIASSLQAAVPINVNQTFDALPAVADWSSKTIAGAGGNLATAAAMDTAMQTNTAASINTVLVTTTATAPGGNAQALWSSAGRNVITRPTGNTATILMATIQNTTAGALDNPAIAYDLSLPSAFAGEDTELAGHRTYYSVTGLENSWVVVPELTTSNAGPKLVTLALTPGSFPAGGTLYLAFVDDNGGPGTDGSFAIDNFQVATSITAPVITRDPASTNVVVTRTIRLSVAATGLGLSYQWYKDGVALDPGLYPSAITAELVILNAQPGDAGSYHVTVANPAGADISTAAVVNVSADDVAPVFVFASELQSTAAPGEFPGFRLSVDEPLCIGVGCSGDALQFFNWVIEETTPPNNQLFVGTILVNGTNVDFSLQSFPRDPAKSYRIRAADNGGGVSDIMDLFENRVPLSQSITAAPSRIFIQGVNGYTGTSDAAIHSDALADTLYGADVDVTVDNSSDAGEIAQALLRFDNMFGPNADQIPAGSRIVSATLALNQFDPGSPANLHRMLLPWDQATVTWNSIGGGVPNDGVAAVVASDAITPNDAPNGTLLVDVTASLQAWSDGQVNNGWVFRSTGTGGWDWNTSESANPPSISVVYQLVACNTAPTISQNPPATTTANEGQNVTITAGVATCGATTYQWQKNGQNINTPAGTAGPSYIIQNASSADNGAYRLVATNPNGTATSSASQLTVNNDTIRPVVLRVNNSNATTLVVTFSKVMGASAGNPANYTQNGVAASAAVLAADGRSVTLTTAARVFPTAYSLSIANVTDNRVLANQIDPNPTVVPITTVQVITPWDTSWQASTNSQDLFATWKSDPTASLPADWFTGNATFGIETSAGIVAILPAPIATALLPNTNTPPDLVTYYFRKDITLPALPAGTTYAINHFIDDGVVFYLNGVEIGRLNMPAAPAAIAYATKATTAGEAAFGSLAFSASAGSHILAAEVHQGGTTTSSDMLFAAQVVIIPTAAPGLTISQVGANAVVRWSADTKWQLENATATVTGPYGAVAIPAANPLGFFSTPATGTNNYFRLHYIGP